VCMGWGELQEGCAQAKPLCAQWEVCYWASVLLWLPQKLIFVASHRLCKGDWTRRVLKIPCAFGQCLFAPLYFSIYLFFAAKMWCGFWGARNILSESRGWSQLCTCIAFTVLLILLRACHALTHVYLRYETDEVTRQTKPSICLTFKVMSSCEVCQPLPAIYRLSLNSLMTLNYLIILKLS
jgi:hypothetical protein